MPIRPTDRNTSASPSTFSIQKPSVVVKIEKIKEVGLRYFVLALYIVANIILLTFFYVIDLLVNGPQSDAPATNAPSIERTSPTSKVTRSEPSTPQVPPGLILQAKNIAAILAQAWKNEELTEKQKIEVESELKIEIAKHPAVFSRSSKDRENVINQTAKLLLGIIVTEHSRILAEEASQPSTLCKMYQGAKKVYSVIGSLIGLFKTASFLLSVATATSIALETYFNTTEAGA